MRLLADFVDIVFVFSFFGGGIAIRALFSLSGNNLAESEDRHCASVEFSSALEEVSPSVFDITAFKLSRPEELDERGWACASSH